MCPLLFCLRGGDFVVVSPVLKVWEGHADYIRALAASPSSPDTWISGSYDHTLKMWDSRQPKRNVLEFSHGAPVEACLFLPGGGLCVSAGGNEVKVSVEV